MIRRHAKQFAAAICLSTVVVACASLRASAGDKDFALPPGMDMSSAMETAQEVLKGKHHFSVTEKLFTYERAQGKVPEKARTKFKLALQEKYEHQGAAALQNFDDAIKLAPKYVPIYFEKAALLADQKQTERAIAVCNQMLAIDPKFLSGLHLRACCYDEAHKYQQAIDDYTSAIALEKSDAAAYEQRGKLYAKLGRQAEAERDKREANQRTVRQKVALAMAQGDSDTALKTIDDAIKIDPTNLELRTSKILLCMAAERQADAVTACTSMMKDCPELKGPLLCMRAKAYKDLSKNDLALADYTQAIPILDHPPTVTGRNKKLVDTMIANAVSSIYVERAALYVQTNQFGKGIADYTKFLATHKAAAKVYLMRAQAYKDAGDLKKAAADCKTAQTLAPSNEGISLAADEILTPVKPDKKSERK